MDLMNTIYEMMVASFVNGEDLMEYACIYGIQESPLVQQRLFQLRNPQYGDDFINEEMDTLLNGLGGPLTNTHYEEDMDVALEYVKQQEDIEEIEKAYLFDEEMNDLAEACIEDGPWSPMQIGGGEEPQPGPSHQPDAPRELQYTIMKKRERTYAKNKAVDRTYKIKIDEQHHGLQLINIRRRLHQMFDTVLDQARGSLAENDLGRVVLHHEGLHDPIVVPLQTWDTLNSDTVMTTIEKVLNSNQELAIDHSFDITIGVIDLPKGGARRRITRIKGNNNSLQLKKSIVTIENEDQLCMARAIGVTWAKLKKCTPEEWKEIPRKGKSNLELVLEHRKVPLNYYNDLVKKNRKEQGKLAQTLSEMAGVPMNRPASINDIEAFEKVLGVRVMVVSARLGNKFITSASTDERPCIYLYHVDDEHFHAITSITGFFSVIYFCEKCLKHYDHRERHECETTCIVCKTKNCLETNPIQCNQCNMTCRSQACYNRHAKVPQEGGLDRGQGKPKSQCQKWWKCPTCYKVINRTYRKTESHRCGEFLCKSCDNYVLNDHECYLRATPFKNNLCGKYIFFDFECSQDEVTMCKEGYRPKHCKNCKPDNRCVLCKKCQNCKSSWCGRGTHRPNFVVAQTVCDKCMHEEVTPESMCESCGTRCENCMNDEEDQRPCSGTCGFRQIIFEGENTVDQFGKWAFSNQHEYFKIIAHNMKGYDGYFLLEYLIDNSMRPDKIIYAGSKIMYMTVGKGLDITVIDSLNFLPMKLSKLPDAFDLKELKKGWFPHFFNTKTNQQYIGPYPNPKFYGCDFMGEKERAQFLEWHASMKDKTFNFRKEMEDYCCSDVQILSQSCLKFRQLLITSTTTTALVTTKKGERKMKQVAIDPFDYVTIASVCMGVYKTKYLKEEWKVKLDDNTDWTDARWIDGNLEVQIKDQWIKEGELEGIKIRQKTFVKSPIAKVPPKGHKESYSKASIEWLEWISQKEGIHIQHALNGGEKTLFGTRYKLDGYCQQTNTAYEYHGCVYHGCPSCFPVDREDTKHPFTDQSMTELYAVTMKKKTYIEQLGMAYKCIWEHDFQKQRQNKVDLKHFLKTLDITDRLDVRDSFFGGRTNASQLYYKADDNEQIKYVDFTSLYPWVNKYCKYPAGHPTIITKDFGNIKDYFGIAKVKILPPRGLYHPVLPYRSNGKLKFPLCRSCADTENQSECTCPDEDRVLIGTWCTPEIQTALRLGYELVKIYEIYDWNETTQYDTANGEGGLFAKYIDTFLKFKQEASGPPDWIQTDSDMQQYIKQYCEKEGIRLNESLIQKNPGLRALAKLCLNSFWGKFGQRQNMKQTDFFHESEIDKFFQTLSNPTKDVTNFHIIADDIIQMDWTYKTDCLPEDNKTNIYLATIKTCWARLKLYSVLEQLDTRVLYYDTDSVIYVSKPGAYDPSLGDYLGELTDELSSGEHIVEFVSGGPKNYAYKTNKNKETCKVRGFTLHYTNSQLINFESVKALVTDVKSVKQITVTNRQKICRDKQKRKLYNREEEKTYQMVYTKRRRLDNYDTVPYGY